MYSAAKSVKNFLTIGHQQKCLMASVMIAPGHGHQYIIACVCAIAVEPIVIIQGYKVYMLNSHWPGV